MALFESLKAARLQQEDNAAAEEQARIAEANAVLARMIDDVEQRLEETLLGEANRGSKTARVLHDVTAVRDPKMVAKGGFDAFAARRLRTTAVDQNAILTTRSDGADVWTVARDGVGKEAIHHERLRAFWQRLEREQLRPRFRSNDYPDFGISLWVELP